MKTPCQEEPELWVSDYVEERRLAQRRCEGCPARLTCLEDAVRLDVSWGVWGGYDLSRTRAAAREPAATRCMNPECGTPLTHDGTRRRYCRDECQRRARVLRNAKAAA